jgi:hypothetical protein
MSPTLEQDVATMLSAGLGNQEIWRLLCLKRCIEAGKLSELTPEHKRLVFMKYLVDSGRLHD